MLTPLDESPQPVREYFQASGYEYDYFKEHPLLNELPSERLGNLPELLERTAEANSLNLLLRAFVMGQTQDEQQFASVIPPEVMRQLLSTGLMRRQEGSLVPTAMLTPCEEYLFAADPVQTLESPDAGNMILWPNPTMLGLWLFSLRRPVGTVLDLGTGCGGIAIMAAANSQRVTGTDLNPRAAEFLAFNQWLNGVSGIECRIGDTFQPVADQRFDLILSNPPFYVTPSSGSIYCENQMELDGFCRALVRATPAHLNEGGFLQITLEWVQVRGEAWQDRLTEWLKDTDCDAWVLHRYAHPIAEYASQRFSSLSRSPKEGALTLADWMAYYRERKVEMVHGGLLAMRRRSGKNWVRMEDLPVADRSQPYGYIVEEVFANQDRLEADKTVDQMLAWKPRLPQDARLDQQSMLVDGAWKPCSTHIRRTGVFPTALAADPMVADFLRRCDGSRTMSELAESLAAEVKVNLANVQQQCCGIVRRLVERRLVLL